MKSKVISIFLLIFIAKIIQAQTMHDFTVTDVHGATHRLYEDYCNQNKVVVIKFFFTTCPPCIANAPLWQQKYVQQGSGNQGVEFFSVTTITSDYDPNVVNFEATYSQTMKGISVDGGAASIVNPFKNGAYGSWYGTPSFAVIAPDRTLHYPVFFNELDSKINLAKTQTGAVPATVSLNLATFGLDVPEGHVKFFVKPKNSAAPKIEIIKNSQGSFSFAYPSAQIPSMSDPQIIMESPGPAYTNKVTASDLLSIQKHILGLTPLAQPYQLAAGDTNSDQKITASDLLNIRKVILGLSNSFPNNTPSYKSIPEKIDINPVAGQTINLEMTIVKTGNVN